MGKKNSRVEFALRDPSYLRVANILGFKALDSNNDVDAIEDYINKNGDPYQNALDAANQATDDIRQRGIDDLNAATQGFNDSIANLTSSFNDQYGQLADQAAQRENYLYSQSERNSRQFASQMGEQKGVYEDLLAQQNDFFTSQYDELNGLLIESQANNAQLQATIDETNRIAANQANAFVPGANPNAVGATAGDDRDELFSTTRKKASKPLNDLTLLTGVGTQGNPLAGLQIA